MPSTPIPSPPPPASATRSGIVNRVAQTFAGLKTFANGIAVALGERIRLAGDASTTGLAFNGTVVEVEPGLHVAGPASLDGVLVVAGLPLASFPAAAATPGALLFDTTGGMLRVSSGGAWVELVGTTGAQTLSTKKHSGAFEVVNVAAGQVALLLPAGAWLKGGTSSTNADVLWFDGTGWSVGATATGRIALGQLISNSEIVNQGGVYRRSGNGTLTYSASLPSVAGSVAHLFKTANTVTQLVRLLNVAYGETVMWGLDSNGLTHHTSGASTAAASPQTVNAPAGTSQIPAGATDVTINNSLVTAATRVFAHVQQGTRDATCHRIEQTHAAAGAFTVWVDAAPTADVTFAWKLEE